jgi:hypothetical protein
LFHHLHFARTGEFFLQSSAALVPKMSANWALPAFLAW